MQLVRAAAVSLKRAFNVRAGRPLAAEKDGHDRQRTGSRAPPPLSTKPQLLWYTGGRP